MMKKGIKILIDQRDNQAYGYKVLFKHGLRIDVYQDDRKLGDLKSCCHFTRWLLDKYNREHGAHYTPEESIAITKEAFKSNHLRDLNAARGWREIQSGHMEELSYAPEMEKEIMDSEVRVERNGKDEQGRTKITVNITNEGIFMMIAKTLLFGSVEDKQDVNQFSSMIDGFCRFLALRGYGKGAADIRKSMEMMKEDQFIPWFHDMVRLYHVTDDDFNQLAMEYLDKYDR